MNELIAVAVITILATISPGPDFAMVTRNSYLYGRNPGLLAAFGIAVGVQLHVFYTIFGIGFVIAHSPMLFTLIKTIGALYLIYIGWKTLINKKKIVINLEGAADISRFQMFSTGFLTNALNPKTTLFVVSTYTQVVKPDTSLLLQFEYGLFMSVAHFIWFSLVAAFFSQNAFRARLIEHQRSVDRVIGSILITLGVSLAFVNAVR